MERTPKSDKKGVLQKREIKEDWVNHLLKFIDVSKMKPYKVVCDTGNGMAGYYLPRLEEKLPWKVTRLFYELDGTFPNHPASPIEEKNRFTATELKTLIPMHGMAIFEEFYNSTRQCV